MKKIKAIALKHYLLGFSFVCIFLFLTALKLGAFNTIASKKQVDFPVISLVPSLSIVDVKVHEYAVSLLLRNDSNKTITAISISSSGVNYRNDMIDTDEVMAPQTTRIEQCGLPSATRPEKGITVLAVTFEDGTSEGESKFINQILDARAGTQAQLARILPLFREILATPSNMRLMQRREAVKLQLEQLSEDGEGRSDEYRLGLHDAKELAIGKLKQLEQIEQEKGEDGARQVFPLIVNTYEKRNLVIQNSLKQAGYRNH